MVVGLLKSWGLHQMDHTLNQRQLLTPFFRALPSNLHLCKDVFILHWDNDVKHTSALCMSYLKTKEVLTFLNSHLTSAPLNIYRRTELLKKTKSCDRVSGTLSTDADNTGQ